MVNLFFFLLVFGTMAALIWSAVEFFRNQEDPLGDRLEELQSHAMVVPTRQPRRKGGGYAVRNQQCVTLQVHVVHPSFAILFCVRVQVRRARARCWHSATQSRRHVNVHRSA